MSRSYSDSSTQVCQRKSPPTLGLVASDVVDASGNGIDTAKAALSLLLTVWRSVHIELDRMGPVEDNHAEGWLSRGSEG